MNHKEKPRLCRPVLVEGKYDKIKLDSLFDATVITCDGFALFRQKDKIAMLRRIAKEKGLLVLTDPDGGGIQIRAFLRGALPKDCVTHLYVPKIKGKEKRKETASKEGYLGVEGMDADRLRALLAPYTESADKKEEGTQPLTRVRLYADGFSGGAGAKEKRASLLAALDLPTDLPANAMTEAINLLGGLPVYEDALSRIAKEPSM